MLYPFLYNRRTKRNITFSQMLIIDGKNQVRIYVDEPPNENFGDFLELEFYLPDGNVTVIPVNSIYLKPPIIYSLLLSLLL